MKFNRSGLFWGLLMTGAGALALAQQLRYIDRFTDPRVWIWIFGLVSLAALIEYALSGWKQWAWLFPAGVFGGLAVTIALAVNGVDTAVVGSPLFIGLVIPFAVAYLTDRAPNWWALIPGGVMAFLALVTLLVDSTGDEWIGALFMFMIAASFLVVYLNNHSRSWALIVAYVTAVLGVAPLMAIGGRDASFYGPVFLLAVALPFFWIYFRKPENWWAIIPAGAISVTALVATFAIAGWVRDADEGGLANALLLGGLAATFAVVWLRHAKRWARVTTVALAAMAVASIFFAAYSQIFWPAAVILVGMYMFFTALRPRIA